MFCCAFTTGKAFLSMFRPGNAAVNTVAEHVALLFAAFGQIDDEVSLSNIASDERSIDTRYNNVRADSAVNTNGFLNACRECNVRFFVTARSSAQITAAVHDAVWVEEA